MKKRYNLVTFEVFLKDSDEEKEKLKKGLLRMKEETPDLFKIFLSQNENKKIWAYILRNL